MTIKNKLLYQEISKHIGIVRLKEKKWVPSFIYQIGNLLATFPRHQKLVIGISSRGGKSKLMTNMLYYTNKSVMKESLYFMMGGTEGGDIAQNQKSIQKYAHYKKIFVETRAMEQCLLKAGLNNVAIYPNCRMRPQKELIIHRNMDRELHCVFFSLISPMKGADLVLEAAETLPHIRFSFGDQLKRITRSF